MKIIKAETIVFGERCILELMDFDKSDAEEWKRIFDIWKKLKLALRDYKAREPNLPEGLSEVAFCIFSGSKRLLSLKGRPSSSFDTFNLKTKKAEQIKAASVYPDLTSFGPKSKWDDLYFLDFYNKGKIDGTFNIYKISTALIDKVMVNQGQSFKKQQAQKRRPRFSIEKEIIEKLKLKPMATDVKLW